MKKIQLKAWQRQALRWLGVFAFYVFCLMVFFRLTFPYEALKDRVVTEFNRTQLDKRLEIEEMGGHWLFGVKATGVRLIPIEAATIRRASDEPTPPAKPLNLDSVTGSVSLLSYVFGTLDVTFGADIGGGSVSGSFVQTDAESRLQLSADDVDIAEIGFLSQGIGLPLSGRLGAEVELELPERKVQKAEGKVELRVAELSIGDGKAKVRNTIALPKLNAGDLSLKADVAAGRMDITEFSANGSDFELSADGKIRLRDPVERSIADLTVAFKFKEAYTTKSDLTKTIFGSPDSKVPALFDMDPQVRQAKGDDGFYRWRVTGALVHPSFRPGNKTTAAPAAAEP